MLKWDEFQHTAARRRLAYQLTSDVEFGGFNTQPPEGGWHGICRDFDLNFEFQHTAARRRLGKI